jgi:tetratricopeptide (TPR) repeat protein
MRSHTLVALALALAVPSLAFAPLGLAADRAKTPAASKADGGAPQDGSDFSAAINAGSVKYVAKDYPGAIELYQKATQLQPRNPLGYYMLGEAQLGAGSLPETEKAWLQADQVIDNGPPGVKEKVLFVLADLRELQKRWDDAKAAWQRYADFCAKNPDLPAFPDSATARIKAIDDMQKQDKAYEIVRQRIKDEKSDAGAPK